jgi:hypothetical protein
MSDVLFLSHDNSPPWWAMELFFVVVLVLVFIFRKDGANKYQRILQSNLLARGAGSFAILAGVFVAYLMAYRPLADALAHKRTIRVHFGTGAVSAFLVLFGLFLLVAGKHSIKFFAPRNGQPRTSLQKAPAVVCAVIGVAAMIGFELFLESLGYRRIGTGR